VSCQNERSQHKNRASAMKVLKARLFDLKLKEQQAKLEQIAGAKKEIGFGSQIRSYVLQPYQMIKDHRTKYAEGQVDKVLNGDIDPFIKDYLMKKASGTPARHRRTPRTSRSRISDRVDCGFVVDCGVLGLALRGPYRRDHDRR